MWPLRRASNTLKSQGFWLCASRISSIKSGISSGLLEGKCNLDVLKLVDSQRVFYTTYIPALLQRHKFSSYAKNKGEDEDDLDDGFSELESESAADGDGDEDVVSAPESGNEESEDNIDENPKDGSVNELGLSDTEMDAGEKKPRTIRAFSELFKAILAAPGISVHSALDKWVEDGKELNREDISSSMLNLRKRKMYGRALQLSEWLESTNHIEFTERDYVSRVDLIAKVRGLQKAENFIEKIPNSFKGEVTYRTLLANCVSSNNVKKAEELFNKMKDLNFSITSFTCNQLIILYKRTDKKKIADVLLLMEKEDIKPSLFTYKMLIDTKGQSNDITGMEQVIETMKAQGIKPDLDTHAIITRHYISGGLKEKAEIVLNEMEGTNISTNRWARRALLPLYAALGRDDEVGRLWKICEADPWLEDCIAVIEAWGRLHKITEAEAVFEKMQKTRNKLYSRHYSALLKVYANHKMLPKGIELVKRMSDNDCRIGPLIWDSLVKLYVGAGEIEKADSILQKATQQNQIKPMFSTFMIIMDQYAKRGDVHNAEKMFHRTRQAGYFSRLSQFQTLVQAYINAKIPAYGIRDRMKADNIFPNKNLAGQLVRVDAFRKTAVSEILE